MVLNMALETSFGWPQPEHTCPEQGANQGTKELKEAVNEEWSRRQDVDKS